MSDTKSGPRTLQEAIVYFADPDNALDFWVGVRWPDGEVACPTCDSTAVVFIKTRRIWKCGNDHLRKQFSVKIGTVMEDSPLGLDKWACAFWLLANCKNGISSYELHRAIGVTQKSAWFMLHRVRLAMQAGSIEMLSGEVEADETYIGGKARFMSKERKARKIKGRGTAGKAIVHGMLERHGHDKTSRVVAGVIPNADSGVIQGRVRSHVAPGTALYTDEHGAYTGIDPDYEHNVINHMEQYVSGNIHTNGIENFWSLLKRGIKGTYVSVEPFHLFRYTDEQAFRFNERDHNDAERFQLVARGAIGKRLTYKELIAEDEDDSTTPATVH